MDDLRDDVVDEDLLAAIRHACDAGGAAMAARVDPRRAALWRAISEDQRRLAIMALQRTLTR